VEECDAVLQLIVHPPDGQIEHQLQGGTEAGIRIFRSLKWKRRPLLSETSTSLTLIQS
jgi:hypothetical protein